MLKQSNLYKVCLSNALHGTHTESRIYEVSYHLVICFLFFQYCARLLFCVIFDWVVVCGIVLMLLLEFAVSVFPCRCCGISFTS